MKEIDLDVCPCVVSAKLEASLSYIRACLTGIRIEKAKLELKWTHKDEYLRNCWESLFKIHKEINYIYQFAPMSIENFESQLRSFIKNQNRILFTEEELSQLLELQREPNKNYLINGNSETKF